MTSMIKKHVMVSALVLLAVAEKLGLEISENAGWYRIDGLIQGRRMYVRKTKSGLTDHVDLSGFVHPLGAKRRSPNGALVQQELRAAETVEEFIKNFAIVARHALIDGHESVVPLVSNRRGRAVEVKPPSQEEIDAAVELALSAS